MQFKLSEDQAMIQTSVQRFAESQLGPHAGAWDGAERLPESLGSELSELGLMGLVLDPEIGGAGLDRVAALVAVEELARRESAAAVWVAVHNATADLLQKRGTSDQKAAWLARLAAAETSLAWVEGALTARTEGQSLQLNGRAPFVWLGTRSAAGIVGIQEEAGWTGYVISKDAPGLTVEPVENRLGLRAIDVAEWHFDGVRVTEADRLTLEGPGGFWFALFGAVATGLGRGAFEEARAYALDRQQFGQPIAQFQAIQWKLADMATEMDAARLLIHRAAHALDRNLEDGTAAERAFRFSVQAAVKAGYHAVQIFGGNGFVREYPVERILRDAKVVEVAVNPTSLTTPRA